MYLSTWDLLVVLMIFKVVHTATYLVNQMTQTVDSLGAILEIAEDSKSANDH